MSAAEEEARAAEYRTSKRRQAAAKRAAEARLRVTDHTAARATAANWAALRRSHLHDVPLIGDDA